MRLDPLGDRALTITFADVPQAAAAAEAIRAAALPDVLDVVAAFDRVAVFFGDDRSAWHGRPARDDSDAAERPLRGGAGHGRDARATKLRSLLEHLNASGRPPRDPIQIAVRYDGPDLDELAATLRLSPRELIERHRAAMYTVLAVGFTPGFAYLGGLPPELHAPRRATPRPRVPAGSLAIGGPYTGVYPSPTPGGWHLIGSTDVAMFDLARDDVALLRVGDRVRFVDAQLRPPLPRAGGEGRGEANERDVGERRTSNAQRRTSKGEFPFDVRRSMLGVGRSRRDVVVLAPGAHTTIQDLGRPGRRAAGVPVGGASDPTSHVVANWLVGNDADAATIECALVGPRLRFTRDAVVAIAGARVADLPFARPFRVARGEVLNLERVERGAVAYLAIAGGVDAPLVLGSRATDARLGIGRPLVTGDALAVASKPRRRVILRDGWRAAIDTVDDAPIRLLRGADFDPAILATTFAVSSRSDRMGTRLSAEPPLRGDSSATRQSQPVAPGAVQLPPDGEPIVLGADAQTIGGYPVVAHVISADRPRLAQRRPGAAVRFVEVTLEEADTANALATRGLARLRCGIDCVARASRP